MTDKNKKNLKRSAEVNHQCVGFRFSREGVTILTADNLAGDRRPGKPAFYHPVSAVTSHRDALQRLRQLRAGEGLA